MANQIDLLMTYNHRQYFDASHNVIGNDYKICTNEKVINSIRSLNDINRDYIVDIQSTYNTAEEAANALEELYGHNSIYLANIADREMKDDTHDLQLRSLHVYANEKVHSEYYDLNKNKTFWEDFQNNATYQKFEQQGGTHSQSDVDELIVAAEEYRWQKAYKENDVYEQDMYDFAASFKERTGVTIVTNGFTAKVDFEMDGQLCKMDNYTFQLMAKNQEHMNIWDNMVSGKYQNFSEVYDAILATGDEKLKLDFERTVPEGQMNRNFTSQSSNYTIKEYVNVSFSKQDQGYDSGKNGCTAADFWNEIKYNIGFTDEYANDREYDDYMENGEIPHLGYLYDSIAMKSNHEFGYRIDEKGNYYGFRTGRLISTQEQRDQVVHKDYATQRIDTLRAKIKSEKAAMAKLENAAEDKTDQINACKTKIELYENQIMLIQSNQAAQQAMKKEDTSA